MEKKKDGFPNEKAIVIPQEILLTVQKNPMTRLLYPTDIGYYPHADNHYRHREEGSRQHILIYCHEGEGWYDIGKGRCTIKKNQFFIIEAGTPHTYAASSQRPWSIYWVHFTGEKSGLFAELFNHTIHIDDSPSTRFEDHIRLFNEILVNLEMGYSVENLEYIPLCLWYLLGSFRYIPQFREINKPQTQDTMQKVVNDINGGMVCIIL